MPKSLKLPALSCLLVFLFAFSASADYGCWNCETDYGSCWSITSPCDQVCVQVGDNEQGSGTWCTEVDTWQSSVCNMDGGACLHTVVDGNEENPPKCPDGSYSDDC